MVAQLVRVMIKLPETEPSFINAFNSSLATFITECFAVMDRGFVLSLIKRYCRIINEEPMGTSARGLMVRDGEDIKISL